MSFHSHRSGAPAFIDAAPINTAPYQLRRAEADQSCLCWSGGRKTHPGAIELTQLSIAEENYVSTVFTIGYRKLDVYTARSGRLQRESQRAISSRNALPVHQGTLSRAKRKTSLNKELCSDRAPQGASPTFAFRLCRPPLRSALAACYPAFARGRSAYECRDSTRKSQKPEPRRRAKPL